MAPWFPRKSLTACFSRSSLRSRSRGIHRRCQRCRTAAAPGRRCTSRARRSRCRLARGCARRARRPAAFATRYRRSLSTPRVGRAGAVSQAHQRNHVVLGTGDDDRQILILFIVSVKHDQLLIAVRGIVEGVEIEREMPRRLIERLDELVDQRHLSAATDRRSRRRSQTARAWVDWPGPDHRADDRRSA